MGPSFQDFLNKNEIHVWGFFGELTHLGGTSLYTALNGLKLNGWIDE